VTVVSLPRLTAADILQQTKQTKPCAACGQALLKLTHGKLGSTQLGPIVHFLYSCSSSSSSRQHALALEGLALAADAHGAQLSSLLRQAGASEGDIFGILQQVNSLQRPALAADGLAVLHGSAVPAAAAGDGSSFRISTYGSSSTGRTLSGIASTDARASEASCDLSLAKLVALKTDPAAVSLTKPSAADSSQLSGIHSFSSSGRAAASGAPGDLLQGLSSKLLWDVPLSIQKGKVAAHNHQQQQQTGTAPVQQQQLKPAGGSTQMADVAAGGTFGIACAAARGGMLPDRYAGSAAGSGTSSGPDDRRDSSLHSSFTSSGQQQQTGTSTGNSSSSSSSSSSHSASLVQGSSLMGWAPGALSNTLPGRAVRPAAALCAPSASSFA
jgi:hypothetical protein